MEIVLDSEDDSTSGKSDLDSSIAIPHSSYSQDVENVSRDLSDTY